MKVLITYMSRSGNTRKVAEAIVGAIEADKEIKQLSEVENLDAYDFAFIGFPIEKFGPAEEAAQFLARNARGKKVALYITHAAREEEPSLQSWLAKCNEAANGTQILGVFNCQGDLAQPVKEAMMKSEDARLRTWGESAKPRGYPDEVRLDRARAFATDILKNFSKKPQI